MGSREQAQAWPHFTSKIKRFPLVLKEKRQIRVQGRKALAYDASNEFVHVSLQRDAWCLVRLQNKRETYRCIHFLNLFVTKRSCTHLDLRTLHLQTLFAPRSRKFHWPTFACHHHTLCSLAYF